MFKITGIREVKRPEASDIYLGPDRTRVEVPAQVEAFYELDVSSNTETLVFEAEVRPGPNGLQIDWSDEFQDLLTANRCTEDDRGAIALLIQETHLARHRGYPMSPAQTS